MESGGRESGGRESGHVDLDTEVRKFHFSVTKRPVSWRSSSTGKHGYSEAWGMKGLDLF